MEVRKMKYLFLDDQEERFLLAPLFLKTAENTITWVKTAEEFVAALNKERYDIISMDHDLGPYETCGNGVKAANALAGFPQDRWPTRVIVHSWNFAGATQMYQILREAGINVTVTAFRG